MPLIPKDRLPRLVLLRAANLCEQGWCQGIMEVHYAGYPTQRCAYGGMLAAHTELGLRVDVFDAVADAEKMALDRVGGDDISIYNDAPGRKKAEVVAMLREVAES